MSKKEEIIEQVKNQVFYTESELNYMLMEQAERLGMGDQVTTTINKNFIHQYTISPLIQSDLASVIINRQASILEEAKDKMREALQILEVFTE